MFRLFSLLLIIPILFCANAESKVDLFCQAQSFEIYRDGEIVELTNQELETFEDIFCDTLIGSKQVPAYGVSIDDLTKEAMKNGIWVKFIFEKRIYKSDMYFDELVINIERDIQGLNVIRGNDGIYDGRCYYLQLDCNLNKLYDFIIEISEPSLETFVELESQNISQLEVVSEEENNDNDNDITPNKDNDIKGGDGKDKKDNIVISKEEKDNSKIKQTSLSLSEADKDRDKEVRVTEEFEEISNDKIKDYKDDKENKDNSAGDISLENFDNDEVSRCGQELLNHLS